MPTHLLSSEGPLAARASPYLLGGIAALFGQRAPSLSHARVHVIGCTNCDDFVAMAMDHPAAQFSGIDPSLATISSVREQAEKFGVKNIDLECKPLAQLDSAGRDYDYIICPDLYSRVEPDGQQSLLQFISLNLAAEGIAFIGHRVLDGSRHADYLQAAFGSLLPSEAGARLAAARQLAGLLTSSTDCTTPYGRDVASWAKRLMGLSDEALLKQLAAPAPEVANFTRFASCIASLRLGYLGDSDVPSMILKHHAPETVAIVKELWGHSLVATEQVMDLLSGRSMRYSVVVHAKRLAQVQRHLAPAIIDMLYLTPAPGLRIEQHEGLARVIAGNGRSIVVQDRAALAAAQRLVEARGSTVRLAEIAAPLEWGRAREALFAMLLAGAVLPYGEPVMARSRISH